MSATGKASNEKYGHGGAICRDCLVVQPDDSALSSKKPGGRCPECGSPRMLRHSELMSLSIAHIDCDAFYASVEKRDNPDLADKPVIIGGGTRGVVSTACYLARIRGVHSAMPMFKALKACPDAVVIKPNMEKYAKAGHEIRSMMQELTPLVQPLSIDEAFLDLTGTNRLHGVPPAVTLARFSSRVEAQTGLSVSVGLSYCKFLAKIASDLNKPRGFSVIGRAEAYEFLRAQPVSMFWGVGKASQAMLARDGITMISEIQDMEESELARRYGQLGLRMSRLSHGRDERKVDPNEETKSVSNEITFNTDLSEASDLVPVLRRLSEKVSARLKSHHLAGQTVVLKLKTADFKTRTRNRTLADPTRLADRIFRNGHEMLLKELDGTRYRLLGIGVTSLTSDETADPEDLIDVSATRRAKAELAIDSLREKFGSKAVELGMTFNADGRNGKPQRDN
ncbi:MAG: DNA polymerase IV [Nitratireductor sp.]|nr:DNA polymerase IV [Nitratireductor sp.]MCC0021550.1 DNA polymerase IV [Nitratireductor sp.]